MTTYVGVGILSNMRATLLLRTRIIYSEMAFAELVLWRVSAPLPGSVHAYKYRLAFVVGGTCVLRYDNEAGKGDHRHDGETEHRYAFTTPDTLIADFDADIARWNDENRDA